MKKLVFIFAFALVAVIFNSCNKPDDAVVANKYVKAIEAQYIAADGDITLKSTLPGTWWRNWSMYARNSVNYIVPPSTVPPAFALVKGNEFLTGSIPQIWWSTPGNNPVSFQVSQGVYSNLTPNEDVRIVCETTNGTAGMFNGGSGSVGDVAYLAILDFNPDYANFPLKVNGFRLGDKLTINTDALTSLPGGDVINIKVAFDLKTIDLAATKLGPVTNPAGIPNGKEFQWSDIVYGPSVPTVVNAGSGNFALYEGFTKKVFGDIIITISLNGGNTITKTVPAQGAGKCLSIILKTTKVGWFDSQTIAITDTDISVETVTLDIN